MFSISVMRKEIRRISGINPREQECRQTNKRVQKAVKKANKRIQKAVKKAKEDMIDAQCEEIETCLNKHNSKTAYQLVKDPTLRNRVESQLSTAHRRRNGGGAAPPPPRQGRISTIHGT